jgi:YfiH family protein
MIIQPHTNLSIYIGNASDNLHHETYLNTTYDSLLNHEPWSKLRTQLPINELLFAQQQHTATGIIIDRQQQIVPFKPVADYLITAMPGIGIGIMTGDCLPIIIYDRGHHVVAAVHAGWRGSVQNIAITALRSMQQQFGTQLNDIKIIFGPSIGACCYVVGQELITQVEQHPYGHATLTQRATDTMFDVQQFNQLQLETYGVPAEAISIDYTSCTFCQTAYCSARRDKSSACRQMTIALLHD